MKTLDSKLSEEVMVCEVGPSQDTGIKESSLTPAGLGNKHKQFDDHVFRIPHCFRHQLSTVGAMGPFDVEELILKLLLKLVKHNESSS